MPEDLAMKVDNFTNLQRAYCRFRAKNLTMASSAAKAGSSGKDSASLSKVGYQIEQVDGAKEYIEYLKSIRSNMGSLDEQDLMTMLKDVYDQSIHDGNYREANNAAKTMAQCLGMLTREANVAVKQVKAVDTSKQAIKEDVDAFKDEDEEDATNVSNQMNERLAKLQGMIREINK